MLRYHLPAYRACIWRTRSSPVVGDAWAASREMGSRTVSGRTSPPGRSDTLARNRETTLRHGGVPSFLRLASYDGHHRRVHVGAFACGRGNRVEGAPALVRDFGEDPVRQPCLAIHPVVDKASKKSATATIRAAAGIAPPTSCSG